MMRVVPVATKAFAFARSLPANRNVAFTALRMMSSAAPSVKVWEQTKSKFCRSEKKFLKDTS